MASLSLGDAIAIVSQVVVLYNKVRHDVPDQVEEAGEQVESIASYLKRLDRKLQARGGVGTLHSGDTDDLRNILEKIEKDVRRVEEILLKWKEGQALGNFKLTGVASKTIFTFGSSPKELAALSKKLDRRLDEIDRWIQLLQTGALNTLLVGQASVQPGPKSSMPSIRSNINILFVGTDGEGRARVAEAYAKLVKEWTVRTGHHWPINWIHSAGLYNKARSETVTLQSSLHMNMWYGDKPPNQAAQSALFDNNHFNPRYKQIVRQDISKQRTRGLTNDMFKDYDYLVCFNRGNIANLENMKDVLTHQPGQAPSSHIGKIVLLGTYGNVENTKEILYPNKNRDGTDSYENWVKTVDRIMAAFRAFLKAELGWIQPPPGAIQH